MDHKSPTHTPVILMCPPDHFEPAPPHPEHGYANIFEEAGRKKFEENPPEFRDQAHEQWHALRDILSRHADIILIEPQPEKPDQVYTADASFSLHLHGIAGQEIVTILSNFTNEKRAHETEKHHVTLCRIGDERLFVQSLHKIEGNGDNVPDPFRGIIWSGYTGQPDFSTASHGRSSLEAHEFLSGHTKIPVVSLQTIKPFYHIDTVLGPLPNGHILAHHESLHPDSHKKFLTHAFENYGLDPNEYLIPVSTKDAFLLAANVRCFGNHVIMPHCSPELQDKVRSKGYEVEIADISAFLAGGGGIHCLSNVINEPMPVPG